MGKEVQRASKRANTRAEAWEASLVEATAPESEARWEEQWEWGSGAASEAS